MPINRIRLDDVDVRNLSATTSVLNTAIGELTENLTNSTQETNTKITTLDNKVTQVQSSLSGKADITSPTFSGTVNASAGLIVSDVLENIIVSTTGLTGTINIDCMSNTVYFYNAAAIANWTFNFRADPIVPLNTFMSNGQMITVVALVTNSNPAFRATGFQIDGTNVTVRWADGIVPSAGNTNSVDIYTFTIIKTANNVFSTFGSLARFA